MCTSPILMTRKALIVFLAAALLLGSSASRPSLAEKPPNEPPQSDPPPVQYHVTWLYGLAGGTAMATDVNIDGIIVGNSDGQAVYWLSPYVTAFNLSAEPGIPYEFHLFNAERINNDGLITGAYEHVDGTMGIYVYDLVTKLFFYSAPTDMGSGSVYPKGINRDGTVVGVIRLDDGSFVGFAWNCRIHHEQDVYVLPEPYLATDINDTDLSGDAEVVGQVDARSTDYAVFTWTLNWDPLEFAGPTDSAAIIGPPTIVFPGPVINNAGAIAALTAWGRKTGTTVSLRQPGATEWDILLRERPWRLAINDHKQVTCSTTPFDDFHYGSVIVGGTVWPLNNEQTIVDSDDQWLTDNAVPEAVADASAATVFGFSPIVGWHYNGRAFLLIPVEYPPK